MSKAEAFYIENVDMRIAGQHIEKHDFTWFSSEKKTFLKKVEKSVDK